MQNIIRYIRIFLTQLKQLSLKDFLCLLKQTLFFDEPILIYKLDISKSEAVSPVFIDGIEIRKGTLADIDLATQTLKPLPWEFQCHEFDGVDDFFIAKDAEGIQHISWVYSHHHRNRVLSLGNREAEIKFCLTLPDLRGRGIYPGVIISILNYLTSQGMQQVYMCVHRDNSPSIRGIEKAGFVLVGEIRLKKIMGIQVSPQFDTSRSIQ